MENRDAIEIILSNRVFLYELTHTVFGGEPTEELLSLIATKHTSEAFGLLSAEEGDILNKMSSFVLEIGNKLKYDEDFLAKVRSEYRRLLVGPARLIAYPWASTYLGKEKILFQESTLKVRNTYRKYGFITKEYLKVADDHIAIELHFMAKLSELAYKALNNNDMNAVKYYLQGQSDFLKNHMNVWIKNYSNDIEKSKTAYLYPQFAKALVEFLNIDLEFIETIEKQL